MSGSSGTMLLVRADRLVSLVLLLRQRGPLTAGVLAAELEVSVRTVLRDVEALSAAGVPVYAERGHGGGIRLLPGFRTELTGLTHDEALALVTAGSARGGQVFGLGAPLAAATRKVVDALPSGRHPATTRFLVEPETDLLARGSVADDVSAAVMTAVRGSVLGARRLRLRYAAAGREPTWRVVDPVGLVTVRGNGYLLALADGADRTYRLSRIAAAEQLDEPARRPEDVDLEQLWRERSARFRAGGDQVAVVLRLHPDRREELVSTAVALTSEQRGDDGWLLVEVTFQDDRHARWALWQLGTGAEALAPESLRSALRDRAAVLVERYGPPRTP